jgi:hypothetical protein
LIMPEPHRIRLGRFAARQKFGIMLNCSVLG